MYLNIYYMYIVLILNFSIDTFYRYTSYFSKVNFSKNFSKINFRKYFYISRNCKNKKYKIYYAIDN